MRIDRSLTQVIASPAFDKRCNAWPSPSKMRTLILLLTSFVAVMAKTQDKIDDQIRYVAIGDSYSIGEGASPNESWPAF
jgi:hypothetical protein